MAEDLSPDAEQVLAHTAEYHERFAARMMMWTPSTHEVVAVHARIQTQLSWAMVKRLKQLQEGRHADD